MQNPASHDMDISLKHETKVKSATAGKADGRNTQQQRTIPHNHKLRMRMRHGWKILSLSDRLRVPVPWRWWINSAVRARAGRSPEHHCDNTRATGGVMAKPNLTRKAVMLSGPSPWIMAGLQSSSRAAGPTGRRVYDVATVANQQDER